MARSPFSVKMVLLSDEMRRDIVPWFRSANRSERPPRVPLLRGFRIFGVHVHHEMRVFGEAQSHLAFRIATIGAMGVGLDGAPDGEAIRGFLGGDGDCVFLISVFLQASRIARGSRNASIPYVPNSRPTPEFLNPPNGAC